MSGTEADTSGTTNANSLSSTEKERRYGPIRQSQDTGRISALVRQSTSRSLERSTSLGDGYTHPHVDNDRLQDVEDEEKLEQQRAVDFVVGWDGPNDPDNPRNMTYARKWLIVIILAMGSLCVTCASSMYTMTYSQLTEEFGVSRLVATLGLSTFILGLGTGPLFLAPLSEFFGRRIIYIISFSCFVVWLVPCAVAQNIATMVISRFFNGLSGSAFLSVAGGTVGDIFDRRQLAAPMMVYTASPFMGPEIGPLIGGFICQYTTWRWVFYLLLIWAGAIAIALILLVPETYHPVLLRRKAINRRKETGDNRWKAPIEKLGRSLVHTVLRSIYRPMLLLIFEPMCLNLCIFSAILLGILYLFFGAFQLVFSTIYGFELWQIGLSFLGLMIGMAIATASDPIWSRYYARLIRNRAQVVGKEEFEPEWRLPPAIAGAPLVTIGLFIFAWTIFPNVHWIAPIIGSLIFGIGTILVYSGIFTFLVESYPLYAASALAANSFLRSSFAGAFPLFGIQMYHKLGYNWATSLLAFLTLVMAPFPYIFFRYGKRIRKKSRFATVKAE
ncbi:MFS multidrug transporter [Coccidioides posadasii str. Silveira]|uniref:MFS multidrug transporter n=3 Tax=Coccidioides posadasii TaxID=199306 RepID=E9CV53_COCPS|nr:MFS multidrug transporter [Coccidioides posadasii str. Silveira]KMM65520.1 benomyl/methotrexate resistance protein [Coccidioides posadasii RMSCC 3488]